MQEFEENILDIRKNRELHPLVEDEIRRIVHNILDRSFAIFESAKPSRGHRADILVHLDGNRRIHFEIFASPGTVNRDIDSLENSIADFKVAVLLDDIDKSVGEAFFHALDSRHLPHDRFIIFQLSEVLVEHKRTRFENFLKQVTKGNLNKLTLVKDLNKFRSPAMEWYVRRHADEKFISDLFKDLRNGKIQNLFVTGSRGCGKSSFLIRIKNIAKDEGLVVIKRIVETEGWALLLKEICNDVRNILEKQGYQTPRKASSYKESFVEATLEFARRCEKPIVFIIDQFERLFELRDLESVETRTERVWNIFTDLIRELSQNYRILWIISAREQYFWLMFPRTEFLKEYNFTYVRLMPFAGEESEELVDNLCKLSEKRITQCGKEILIQNSGNHPQHLVLSFISLFEERKSQDPVGEEEMIQKQPWYNVFERDFEKLTTDKEKLVVYAIAHTQKEICSFKEIYSRVNSQLAISERDLRDTLRHIQDKLMLIKQPKRDVYEFFHASFAVHIREYHKHEFPEEWDIRRLVDVAITLSREKQKRERLPQDLERYLREIFSEPIKYRWVIDQVVNNMIDNGNREAAIEALMLYVSSLRKEGYEDMAYDRENEILQVIENESKSVSEKHDLIDYMIAVYLEDKNTLSGSTLMKFPQEINVEFPSFRKARTLCKLSKQIEPINSDLTTMTLEKAEKMFLDENCDWEDESASYYWDFYDENGMIRTLDIHKKIDALTQICVRILQKGDLYRESGPMNWAINYLLSHELPEIAVGALLQNEKKRSGLKIRAMLKMTAAKCLTNSDRIKKKLLREANELLRKSIAAAQSEKLMARYYKLYLTNLFEMKEFYKADVVYEEAIKQISNHWILGSIQSFFEKQKEEYSEYYPDLDQESSYKKSLEIKKESRINHRTDEIIRLPGWNVPLTIWWDETKRVVKLIDQSLLPNEVRVIECDDWRCIAEAISVLRIRGAPALGAAGAYAMALEAQRFEGDEGAFFKRMNETRQDMMVRPTAVNLAWAVHRVLDALLERKGSGTEKLKEVALREAETIVMEDIESNKMIGRHGLEVFWKYRSRNGREFKVLTHSHAGSLATCGYGTVFGVIRAAIKEKLNLHIFVDETRPLLQGTRIAAWELAIEGIPMTLIADNAAGFIMKKEGIDMVIVGADRIAANGDTANSIGTYSLSILAREHGIPFYIAAPSSSIDIVTMSGDDIEIEMRDYREVTHVRDVRLSPFLDMDKVRNYAFDVTPYENISGIITEVGMIREPYKENIWKIFNK
jgi:methylthioribose-1-phosphate isomerase